MVDAWVVLCDVLMGHDNYCGCEDWIATSLN
jgi:hypothetical protein